VFCGTATIERYLPYSDLKTFSLISEFNFFCYSEEVYCPVLALSS
jgi:hypothetical protein